MGYSQYIYTSTCTEEMTPKLAYQISCQSVNVSQELGLTGRVFANQVRAFSVIEGEPKVMEHFFDAFAKDVFVETVILHGEQTIEEREFSDYSVWLNLPYEVMKCSNVFTLNQNTVHDALPDNPSRRLRVMTAAFLNDTLEAA